MSCGRPDKVYKPELFERGILSILPSGDTRLTVRISGTTSFCKQ